MKQALTVFVLASSTAACSYGMTADKLRLTTSGRGVNTQIRTSDMEFRGELIEVRSEGLLILASSGALDPPAQKPLLRVVPFTAIMSSRFDQLGRSYQIERGRPPQPADLERLRLVSRFPYGLAPELLQKLLENNGQTELAGAAR